MKHLKKIILVENNADANLRFRRDLIIDLIRRGYRVQVFVPYERENIEQIRKLITICNKVRLYSLKRASKNPIVDLIGLFELYFLLFEERPTIVLCYSIKPAIYGSIAATLAGIKNLISVINGTGFAFSNYNSLRKLVGFWAKLLLRISIRFNKCVFFYNLDDLELFENFKLIKSNKSFVVNGSGININEYNYSAAPYSSKIAFLMASRFLIEKGILEYLTACKILNQKYNNARFLLAGKQDSNPSSLSKEKIRYLSKQANVELIGWVDMREILKKIDVFVLPSYREGIPRSILEAMAIGRPIITTDVPGCKETVINGYNGYLILPRDVNSLVDAMENFIKNPSLILKMGKASRKLVEEKFDVLKVNEKLISYIEELIK